MESHKQAFLDFVVGNGILRFGRFTLKSGRVSPYFFNAGLFNTGERLAFLGRCYAAAVRSSGAEFDMLFGPAYKGIPLAVATAMALARDHGVDRPWCFNRKEEKDHGEGGATVGAPLKGRVLIVDDVVSAGTAVRESAEIIGRRGAVPAGVVVAMDRQEKGAGGGSAIGEIERSLGVPVASIVTLDELIRWMESAGDGPPRRHLAEVAAYRREHGV